MMKIAVRGEGSTDIGSLHNGCLDKGPMIILIEKLECFNRMLSNIGFEDGLDINDFVEWIYIHKTEIADAEQSRRSIVLRGKKEHRDSYSDLSVLKGFYDNSEAFAHIAKNAEADLAIFFVDTDKDWCEDRYHQVKAGLIKHGFGQTGIPMIPVKISESWLMCYLSDYQNCPKHENATTDKTSPHYPKNVCENSGHTRDEIAENCDPNRIDMPSFNRFRDDFKIAINSLMPYKIC